MFSRIRRSRFILLSAAAPLICATLAMSQTSPSPDKPKSPESRRPEPPKPVDLSGTLDGFNYSPRGEVQSLMLKDGDKMIQLLLPPPVATAVAASIKPGDSIKATGRPDMGLPDHAVYRGVTLTAGEKTFTVPEPGRERDEKTTTAEGTIKRLNYGPRGEVDGAILDTGDFIHTGPPTDAMKLTIGEKLSAEGHVHPLLTGKGNVIDADKVNGATVQHPPHPRDGAGPDGPRPPRDGAGPDGPRNRGPRDDGADGPPRRGPRPDGNRPPRHDDGPPPQQ